MFFLTILVVLAIVFRKELKSFIEDCISFFEKGVENPELRNCQISPMIVETIKRDEGAGIKAGLLAYYTMLDLDAISIHRIHTVDTVPVDIIK